jgi:hypothetical protein
MTLEGETYRSITEYMYNYTLKAPTITFDGVLTNVYTKSEVYTKAEVDAKIPSGAGPTISSNNGSLTVTHANNNYDLAIGAVIRVDMLKIHNHDEETEHILYFGDERSKISQSINENYQAQLNFEVDNGSNTMTIEDQKVTINGELVLFEHLVNGWATAAIDYNSWNDTMLITAGTVKTIIDSLLNRITALENQL